LPSPKQSGDVSSTIYADKAKQSGNVSSSTIYADKAKQSGDVSSTIYADKYAAQRAEELEQMASEQLLPPPTDEEQARAAAMAEEEDQQDGEASSEDDGSGDLLSPSSSSSAGSAAFIVLSVWLAAFAGTSAVLALTGAIVALQWPHPHFLCWRTPFSDLPSPHCSGTGSGSTAGADSSNNSSAQRIARRAARAAAAGCSCCSLYAVNLGFASMWLVLLVVMAVARDPARLAVCLALGVSHASVALLFRSRFRRFGPPDYTRGSGGASEASGAGGGGRRASAAALAELAALGIYVGTGARRRPEDDLPPGAVMGVPVAYDIPFTTVTVGVNGGGGAGVAAEGVPCPPAAAADADPAEMGAAPWVSVGGALAGVQPVAAAPTAEAAAATDEAAATAAPAADDQQEQQQQQQQQQQRQAPS
jgi:hypothetical protein